LNEEPKENKKNKYRLFWIIFGIIVAVLAAAAFCIPLGINLAQNVGTTTTTTTTTTTAAATSTVVIPTTTTNGKP
jgi:flagellar basal body-associated protein FliL